MNSEAEGEAGRGQGAGEVVLRPVPREDGRTRVLLALSRPDQGLTRALLEHLSAELPGLSFTLDDSAAVDAIWHCGFELTGGPERVRRLRAAHPGAVLLVTRRGRRDGWERAALAAGANHAVLWPVGYPRLARLLGGEEHGAPATACL